MCTLTGCCHVFIPQSCKHVFYPFGRYIEIFFEYEGTRNRWPIDIYNYQSNKCMKEMFSCRTQCLLNFDQNKEMFFVKNL